MPKTDTKKKVVKNSDLKDLNELILWNDDVNSFDDIIDALIDICSHGANQAEQCAMIAHYKGKCDIKSGQPFDKLFGLKRLFDQRQINTSIE